ncbi:MAG: AAA family ATPase [Phycisphaerales bacterium]|nr:AAA family ATPase [Phycisphaerales bacterium]
MLDSIHVNNFRSCRDVTLRLGEPVIALIGRNGAGKTNLLNAIEYTARLASGSKSYGDGISPLVPGQPVSFELRFSIAGRPFVYSTDRHSSRARGFLIAERLSCDGQLLLERRDDAISSPLLTSVPTLSIAPTTNALYFLLSLFPEESDIGKALLPVSRFLSNVRYYPESVERRPAAHPIPFSRYEEWERDRATGRVDRAVAMRLIHMGLKQPDKLEELEALLGASGLQLVSKIDLEVLPSRERTLFGSSSDDAYYSIRFTLGSAVAGSGARVAASQLSAGTWRIVSLLTHLVFDEASCMLVEQPEDCMHAGLLGKLLDIFSTYSHRTQFICTTHSPRVINLIDPRGIRLVSVDTGFTCVRELAPAEVRASEDYAAEQGTLSEFLETL